AEVLHRFLAVHLALADIVAGTGESTVYFQFLNHDNRTVCHGAIRLRAIVFSIFYARQQYRASIDWQCVRNKAAEIVDDLAYRTPELKDRVFIPLRLMDLHQVLPIGFGFYRRSHARNEFRRRLHSRSRTRQRRSYALAKVYLKEQRSLPAISDPSQESCDELSVSKALDSVADLVDECLKAGKRPGFHNVCPILGSGTEGAILQTIFSSLTCPAINPGMHSVAATAGSKLASHGALSLGTVCAPVPQTMSGSLTSCYTNSGVGLMENAGAPVAHVSRTVNLNHAESSGDIAAPVSQSQTTLGSMAHPGINPRMLSVENAGNNYLKDITQDIDKVKSMVNDLCVLCSKQSKDSVQHTINTILENIKAKVEQLAKSDEASSKQGSVFYAVHHPEHSTQPSNLRS
ncbi:unnamed protein product, partial [Urochloa humidicola]